MTDRFGGRAQGFHGTIAVVYGARIQQAIILSRQPAAELARRGNMEPRRLGLLARQEQTEIPRSELRRLCLIFGCREGFLTRPAVPIRSLCSMQTNESNG